MTLTLEDWRKCLLAWTNLQKQATIDLEQASIYIDALNKKISEVEKNGKKLEVRKN